MQQLLAFLNLTLDSEDLSFFYKQKSHFYELWHQYKEPKNMEINETSPDFLYERYIRQFQSEPTHKIH